MRTFMVGVVAVLLVHPAAGADFWDVIAIV
jgi:hypothetical protein